MKTDVRNKEYTYYLGSIYIALGLFLSQYLNISVYKGRGNTSLQTWWNILKISITQPSIILVYICSSILTILAFLLMLVILKSLKAIDGIVVFKKGFCVSIVLSIFSQFLFSSMIRFIYEFFFSLIVFIGLSIRNEFFPKNGEKQNNEKIYQELWDLMKLLCPISINFPLLVSGGSLISTMFSKENGLLSQQLYRHIILAMYFEVGVFVFILGPIAKNIILLKNKLRGSFKSHEMNEF